MPVHPHVCGNTIEIACLVLFSAWSLFGFATVAGAVLCILKGYQGGWATLGMSGHGRGLLVCLYMEVDSADKNGRRR